MSGLGSESLCEARLIEVGDRAKLGNRWQRVSRVIFYEPPTEEDVQRHFEAVVAARDYSELRLYEAVRDLNFVLSARQRDPEPYVEIWGGSATTYWNKRYSPTEVVKVRRT